MFTSTQSQHSQNKFVRVPNRRGSIIVLSALLMSVMLAMLAFAVDVGYIEVTETELRRTVDAGVMAGAGELVNGDSADLETTVLGIIAENSVGGREIDAENVEIEVGHWDSDSRQFSVEDYQPSAIRLTATQPNTPLFFGRLFGPNQFSVTSKAVAVYQPRDIMLVLDYSGSMSFDSRFYAYERSGSTALGESDVKANMQTIWNQLVAQGHMPAAFDAALSWDGKYISSSRTSTIKSSLGLSGVSWPFTAGSWSGWKSHVRGDSWVDAAGYRRDYGRYTLLDYLLAGQYTNSNLSILTQTDVQPITAVKNGVELFLAYVQEVDTNDRVGLSVYTSASNGGYLESGLTTDMQSVEDISRARQAAHYKSNTNIGDGLKVAIEEMSNNARAGAFKMIVLMTDGEANSPYSSATASKQYVRDQAAAAAALRIPIVTISLGAGADTTLMDDVADITSGIHFNIPGGQSVEDYEEDLKDVFRQIASDRPLKLVQ